MAKPVHKPVQKPAPLAPAPKVEKKELVAKDKHTLMRFSEEKLYNGDLLYPKGEVVQVPNDMVERWLRRGGVVIDSHAKLAEVEAHEKKVADEKEKLLKAQPAGQDKKEAPKFLDPAGSDGEDED